MVQDENGCRLLRAAGPELLEPTRCEQLRCEPGLLSIFRRANVGILAALFALYLASTVVWAARWRRLLLLAGLRPTLGWVWRVTMQAQAAGILLPGGLGGDALRGASAVGAGASVPIAVGSLLLDRAVGLATLAAVGAAAGASVTGASNIALVAVLACLPIGFVVGILILRSRVVRTAQWLQRGILARTVHPVVQYLADERAPRAVVGCVLLSFVVSAVQFVVNRGLIAAIGATPTSEKAVYVGLTLVFTTAVIPSLPGGWGTVDAAYIYFLGLAGLSSGSALAVCLLFRLFWYLLGAIGAFLLVACPAPTLIPSPEPRLTAERTTRTNGRTKKGGHRDRA
jgi:uncharacterized membrane protein YbhN (UPF0104 family)